MNVERCQVGDDITCICIVGNRGWRKPGTHQAEFYAVYQKEDNDIDYSYTKVNINSLISQPTSS